MRGPEVGDPSEAEDNIACVVRCGSRVTASVSAAGRRRGACRGVGTSGEARERRRPLEPPQRLPRRGVGLSWRLPRLAACGGGEEPRPRPPQSSSRRRGRRKRKKMTRKGGMATRVTRDGGGALPTSRGVSSRGYARSGIVGSRSNCGGGGWCPWASTSPPHTGLLHPTAATVMVVTRRHREATPSWIENQSRKRGRRRRRRLIPRACPPAQRRRSLGKRRPGRRRWTGRLGVKNPSRHPQNPTSRRQRSGEGRRRRRRRAEVGIHRAGGDLPSVSP